MATIKGRNGVGRKGAGHSLYLSKDAEEILTKLEKHSRRSWSEITSLLIETYGPEMLVDRGDGK